jgi:hypothetical protein
MGAIRVDEMPFIPTVCGDHRALDMPLVRTGSLKTEPCTRPSIEYGYATRSIKLSYCRGAPLPVVPWWRMGRRGK